MNAGHLSIAAAAALLVFWIVGAYNRMVALRTALVARFAPIDDACRQRQALLDEQLALLSTALASAGPRLEALRAASRQFDTARELASVRPGAPSAVSSLRVAEDILADARARLPVQSAAGVDLPRLNTRLAASDTNLGYARSEFNESVNRYNRAVGQFPTILLARLFSFRPAATF
ncbi:MAG: LemA family protein [Caldimonas sp.]